MNSEGIDGFNSSVLVVSLLNDGVSYIPLNAEEKAHSGLQGKLIEELSGSI